MQARDAVFNARTKELKKSGISIRESATLHAISSIGPDATPTVIARWIYRKPHTVAAILQRMQKRGLVKLHKDRHVKNLVRISLTEEGKKSYQSTLKRKSMVNAFSLIDDEEVDSLKSNLEKIRDKALKQTGDVIQRKFP